MTGTVEADAVREGDAFEYTITVTNDAETATADATGIIVSDLIPTGLTYVTHATASGIFTPGTGVWDLTATPLAPGQSLTLQIATTVSAGTAGTLIDIAGRLTGLNETDVDSTSANAAGTEDDDFTSIITVLPNAATRSISGRTFLDADNNGTIGAEVGVAGITVNAYGPDGTLTGTATTNASGDYTIATATTEAVRLEFVGFNALQTVTTAQIAASRSQHVQQSGFSRRWRCQRNCEPGNIPATGCRSVCDDVLRLQRTKHA